MAVLVAACSNGVPAEVEATATVDQGERARAFVSLDPEVEYPESFDEATGLWSILGTPDLGIGRQRVSFVLLHEKGLLRFPTVRTNSYYYPSGTESPREGPLQSGQARYYDFPLGTRGIYVAHLEFDRAGTWALEVNFPDPEGGRTTTQFAFEVGERASAPNVGDTAPRSKTRTLADVSGIEQLTTGSEHDPGLYGTSIADSVAGGRPFVVVFASPAFCTNAFCGPQVDVLSSLKARYEDRADFIHVDIYENPHEIQGDLERGVRSPALEEWGITTDEWTFIVDREGLIAGRFESFVSEEELEQALTAVLDGEGA